MFHFSLLYNYISEDEDDAHTEGFDFGFLKGLSIGLELGFMETAVQLEGKFSDFYR